VGFAIWEHSASHFELGLLLPLPLAQALATELAKVGDTAAQIRELKQSVKELKAAVQQAVAKP
jgi:hypothetical protein